LTLVASLISWRLVAAELPTGQTSPEGTACDAIVTYGRSDFKAWKALLIRPCYGEEGDKRYDEFKKAAAAKFEANKTNASFYATRVLTCFKARSFTEPEAASFGVTNFGFVTNRFVDLVIERGPENTGRMRYHVICDKNGKWCLEPRPDLVNELANRLNAEPRSVEVLFQSESSAAKSGAKASP
jgi:hypothetical protein